MMKNVYKKLFEFRKLTGKVVKGANNPFHKTKYADLNSVIEATDPALEECGLIWIDRPNNLTLESLLVDVESGETITFTCPLLLAKQDMQQLGSGITYARRYNRLSALGMQTVDDDANVSGGLVFVRPVQIKKINELILKAKVEIASMLPYYHVSAIKDLTEDKAKDLIKTLELRVQKEVA
jgi:hypothetical protein